MDAESDKVLLEKNGIKAFIECDDQGDSDPTLL